MLRNHPKIAAPFKVVRAGGPPLVVEGVDVLAIDANHCPGSCMFLFINHRRGGEAALHTGDCRMSRGAYDGVRALRRLRGGGVSCLHLDTTYCDARYVFPAQERVLDWAARAVAAFVRRYPSCLVCIGAYYIGKERVQLAVARALGAKLYVDARREATMRLLEWPELEASLTGDPRATQVHVVAMGALGAAALEAHRRRTGSAADVILAVRPTGWAHTATPLEELRPRWSDGARVATLGVPYSEHSSFVELQQFVRWLKPLKVLPHVNVGDREKRERQDALIRPWYAKRSGVSE